MKVSLPKEPHSHGTKEPLLPLVPVPQSTELDKANSTTYHCYADPANRDNSPKYKRTVRILAGGEDIRTMLEWSKEVEATLQGMGLDTWATQAPIVKTMLSGTPLTLFEAGLEKAALARRLLQAQAAADDQQRQAVMAQPLDQHRHVDDVAESIRHILRNLIEVKALALIERYLRRECRKPVDMKVRTYYQHLLRINKDELPKLPPFGGDNQKLSDDKLIDIIMHGCPKSWTRELDRLGFDPWVPGTDPWDVVAALERIETSEGFEPVAKQSSSKNSKKDSKKGSNKSDRGKYCEIHGSGSHDTSECFKIKALKKQKSDDASDKKSNGKFKNKTWSKKAEESAQQSKKDLAAFVKKQIAKGVKKELKSIDKKRKADSDDEFDLNAFDKDLEGFNYQDMEGLSIEDDKSDGEVSV